MTLLLNNRIRIALLIVCLFFVTICAVFPSTVSAAETQIPVFNPTDPFSSLFNTTSALYKAVSGQSVGYAIVKFIALGILSIFAFFATITGMLLNYVIATFVLGFGDLVITKGLGGPIDQAWAVIRDVVNIVFIFALLYIGIMTIVDAGRINTKRLLASVIISALLVNFSLLFSKAIIDVANLTTFTLYTQMSKGNQQINDIRYGISGQFFAATGVQTILQPNTARNKEIIRKLNEEHSITYVILYAFAGSFFLMKLAFAFALGAVLLVIRFVMLIFLMATSPIAFASSVFPAFAKLSQRWWSAMISQAFIAPVYIFILYIILIMLNSSPLAQSNDITQLFEKNQQVGIQVLAIFVLAGVGLIGAAVVGKQMSTAGANATIRVGGWMRGKAVGALRTGGGYATSYVGRNTAGRVFDGAGKLNERLEGTRSGRNFKRALTVLSGGTFNERARQNALKAGAEAKYGGRYSRADDKAFEKERKQLQSREERKHGQKETERKVEEAQLLYDQEGTEEAAALLRSAVEDLGKEVEKLSTKELEDRGVKFLNNSKVAIHLTSKQVDAIEKSENFTEVDKQKIKDTREAGLKAIIDGAADAPGALKSEWITNKKTAELAKLPASVLTTKKVSEKLSTATLAKIVQEGSINTDDLRKIREHIHNSGDLVRVNWFRNTPIGRQFPEVEDGKQSSHDFSNIAGMNVDFNKPENEK